MSKIDVKYKDEIVGYTLDEGKSIHFLDTPTSKKIIDDFINKGETISISSRKLNNNDVSDFTILGSKPTERKLKISHKALMIVEASFIYCKRHNLGDISAVDLIMRDDFDCSEGNEFDNICKDLRCFRHFKDYILKEITPEEYEMCVDEFGEH